MTVLRLTSPGAVDQLLLDGPGPYAVGRDESAALVIADRRVSRRHGRVEWRDGQWWLVDTSTSGLFDGYGQRVGEHVLSPQVQLRLGAADGPALVVTADAVPPAPRPTPAHGATPAVITIGRAPESDLRVDDLIASRHHARIDRVGDGWAITDLSSANGTFVDGVRITSTPLPNGSTVAIGHHSFVFDDGDLRPAVAPQVPTLEATHLSVVTDDGLVILEDVCFAAMPSTLTAIVGPTGAGKSTLLKALAGSTPPTSGTVRIGGRDFYRNFDELQLQVGYVPQDDIVHAGLTVRQALGFGAELRLPDDTSPEDRDLKVEEVCASLGLSDHIDKPISRLSGGQRKRVSVGMELLTEPAILYLDEPTSGLDPGYEQAVMQLLRLLADHGRTIVVVTHSMASLELCDQVIFLGTGGWVGYAGDPQGALAALGADDFPAVFRSLESPNPNRSNPPAAPAAGDPVEETNRGLPMPYPSSGINQFGTLVRRNVALIVADRRGVAVLAFAALIPAVLIAALVGSGVLSTDRVEPSSAARTLLGGIIISIGVIGAANGLREIVKETSIYRRERAAGLRRGSYLAAKVVVLGAVTSVQAIVLVVIATAMAGGPSSGNLLPGRIELLGVAMATGLATLCIGLLVSAFVSSSEKALALIPVVFVALWLFSGIAASMADKPVLREVALVSPSNWGMAAAASTADLLTIERCGDATGPTQPSAQGAVPATCDARWQPGILNWVWCMVVLVAISVLALLLADWALARKEPLPHLRRQHGFAALRSRLGG